MCSNKMQNALSLRSQLVKLAVLVICIPNASAIICFVCDSSDNPSCADLKSNTSIMAQECTLDKIKSLDTWLFELNKLSFFDTGANKNPLMNCQKVVARDPETMKMVTARFCQLDTADSDACGLLRTKLQISNDGSYEQNGRRDNGRLRKGQHEPENAEEERFHCSICTTDRCNGGATMAASVFILLPGIILSVIQITATH